MLDITYLRLKFIVVISLLSIINSRIPEEALGTLLPRLTIDSKYRVFNDLFKQSSQFESYDSRNWNRQWDKKVKLNSDLYPISLIENQAAGSKINLFAETDSNLIGNYIRCSFEGEGEVKILQSNVLKVTLNNTANNLEFKLETLNSIMVYITKTHEANPVKNLRLIPSDISKDMSMQSKTFHSNFLDSLKPFKIIRYCYWQGQNINKANYQILWSSRIKDTSASQISYLGISFEHIVELTNFLDIIPWFCIPETSDEDYIKEMARLIRFKLPENKKIYIEFGNAYTVMNDIPDTLLTNKFSIFLDAFGRNFREKIVFVLCYRNTQYFINAIGMRSTPVNYEYIDAIGIDANFADNLNIFNSHNIGEEKFKELIIHQELEAEALVNRAYKFASKVNKTLVTFSGNPQLKAPRYEWRFTYDFRKNQTPTTLLYKNQEIELAEYLRNFHKNSFVKEIFHDWLIRLKNIGLKTLISPILVDPYTDDRDFIPLLDDLSSQSLQTSNFYKAFVAFSRGEKNNIDIIRIEKATDLDDCRCVWGDCIDYKCICYEGFEGLKCDIKSEKENCNDYVGVNLGGIADWDTSLPFIDMMKMARGWNYELPWGGWASGEFLKDTVLLDKQNYPVFLPENVVMASLMARDLNTHFDKGIYTVLYDGDGTLTFSMDVVSIKRGVGRIEVDVSPSNNMNNGILLKIERTNPKNPIRNIRVIRPGFEKLYKKMIYHPMFLSQLKPFSTIRFMDFFNTNAQTNKEWEDRTPENFRTYTINGAPVESLIKLCNQMGKHMWINVPHLASDDYIMKLGEMIKKNLRPDLKIYVEYSNEVWGNLFPGGIHAEKEGLLKKFSTTDGTQARFCYLSYMTNKISGIFRSIFSNQAERTRLKIVISTQAVNSDTTKRILECQKAYLNVDAVAVAPYFSVKLKDEYTMDYLFNTLFPQNLEDIDKYMKEHAFYAKKYNIELLNYESGQGLTGSTTIQTNFQINAQRDTRMVTTYIEYLKMLKSNNVSLTMIYTSIGNWSKYGSWGTLRYHDEKPFDSKKYYGIIQYLKHEKNCLFTEKDFTKCELVQDKLNESCNGMGICFLGKCLCYENSKGDSCQDIQYIDFFDCGYKCTFDQGVCVLKNTIQNKRYYGCICKEGYKGNDCAIPICNDNCSYNGVCTKPGVCECFPGKTGKSCEIDCGCNGYGTCNENGTACLCDAGYEFSYNLKKCVPLCGGLSSDNCIYPNELRCTPSCKFGKCLNSKCVCFSGYGGPICDQPTTNPKAAIPLGINLSGLAYWSTQYIFKNHIIQSSEFIPLYYPNYFNSTIQYIWNTQENIPKLPSGYPKELKDHQKISKLLFRDIKLFYPKDLNFVLLYDGEGIIDLGFDAKITKRRAGRIEFIASPSNVRDNGVFMSILKTNPNNPISNIRIVNVKDEYNFERDLITDAFDEFMKNFSTIRFMDLLHTNGNKIETVSDETPYEADTQAKVNGINSDYLIKLCNYVGANAWINIPHKANDEYVNYIAKKLKENLSPGLIIYVEYSNEVWNTFFDQGKYAMEQAILLGLPNYHKFYAKRSLEIFNIFKFVFGSETNTRIKFVISTQFVSTWVTRQILEYPGLAETANILAVGSYYDCENLGSRSNASLTAIKSVDEIIKICADSMSSLDKWLQSQKDIADAYKLNITAYESGTAISEQETIYSGRETPGLTEKLISVNRDPRMKGIYKSYLNKLKEFGYIGKVPCMLFSSVGLPSKYGSWGLLDYSEEIYKTPSHPKFEAIKEFLIEWNVLRKEK